MTTTPRRAAMAACALLLLAFATPGTNASTDEAFSACDYNPVSFHAQPAGLPRGLAKMTPDSPVAINAATARGLDPCDAGVGGGGGGGRHVPQPECASFAATQSQSFAQGLEQARSAAALVRRSAVDDAVQTLTAEHVLAATEAVTKSALDLCMAGLTDIFDDSQKCVAQERPGISVIYCIMGCGILPSPAKYYIQTTADDPGSPTLDPFVYGAVNCWSGTPPAPPYGVSCAGDNGHCWNEWQEGLKWLRGWCTHLAAGNQPIIVARRCDYK